MEARHYLLSGLNRLGKFLLRTRILNPFPTFTLGTDASNLINFIGERKRLLNGNYLEIGVEYGRTFEAVKYLNRFAVDPNPKFSLWFKSRRIHMYPMTSDSFFQELDRSMNFSCIFLDGLHTAEQTFKDLANVCKFLTSNSVVIIDDTVPLDEWSAIPNQEIALKNRRLNSDSKSGAWQGDVYRVILTLSEIQIEHLHFVTLFGMSNPKTILWATDESAWVNLSSRNISELVPAQDFSSLSNEYIPISSNPMQIEYFKSNLENIICSYG